ncbi:MAG TPA: Ig-like domain-containing protein, partial [Thermoanaerobaculia bacterium]
QGNAFAFTGVLENERYTVTVDEIGGAARHMAFTANFPKGSAADPLKLVLPAFGSVEVRVTQGGAPAGSARVSVSAGGRIVTVYTDAAGIAVANAIPLGSASVQVVTVDGAFSGSANVNVTSQSIPAIASIALGAYAGVTGLVEAETGGPSVGTRVVASFGSRILEMQTDLAGRYTFQGIPTSTTVNLTYFAPDGVTIGASQPVQIGANDASRIIPANTVRLDATQPQVTAIFPADGTANVSPDSSIRVTFSEPIGLGYLTTTYFQLVPADTAATVNTTFTHATNADGTFTVTMRPPSPPAGQNFPLKSNTLYRVIISGEISDLTGSKLPAARGASFITSDYTEPRVLKVIPSPLTALQPATTFEFRFNEPIDPSSWQPGGGGVFQFWKVTAADASGAIIAEKSGRAFLDPSSPVALFFTPNDPIEQESFYRITFSGVRDLQANLLAPQTFHFFSYDLVKPFVTFQSPVPEGYPLISGVEYLLSVDVRNGSANGTPASDVSKVDFFRVDGGAQTYLFTATKAPFVYRIVAPDAPPAGSTVTFRAIATDHSLNESEPATASWQVKPNEAPKNVVVTMTPPASVYPGNRATAAVTFNDEGVFATVRVVASAVHANGTAYSTSQIKQLTRAKVDDRWPDAIFQFDLPGTLAQGTKATFTATVTDVRGLEGTGEAQLDVAADAIAPEIVSLTPFPQTRFNIAQKYQISAVVRDLESGAAEVTFSFDNKTITVPRTDARVTPAGDRTWLFSSGEITVPAKNVDTTVAITVTAKDYGNNVISRSTEVIYIGVNDPSVPRGAFLCPIDGAVYPAGASGSLKLQISATDDIAVTAVKFNVPGIAEPVPATRVGTSSVYEATVTVTLPAAGQSLEVRATISDANPDHDVEVSASIKSVAIDLTIDDRTEAIHAGNVATY